MTVQNTLTTPWPANLPPFPGLKRNTQARMIKVAQAALIGLAAAFVWYLHATVPPLFFAPAASVLFIPFEYLRNRYNVKQAQIACLRDVATSPEKYKNAPEIDEKFIFEAIRVNPLVFAKLEKEKREDDAFIAKAIIANPRVFEHLENKRYIKRYADLVSQVLYKSDSDQINLSKHYDDVKQLLKYLPHMYTHFSKEDQLNTLFVKIVLQAEPKMYSEIPQEINSPYLKGVYDEEVAKRKDAVKKEK